MLENFQSPAKILIRKEWNKKLIRFIKNRLQKRIIYLGLPSPNAGDILEWIDYIDEVIAFQCRDYPHPSSPGQSRQEVIRLEQQLASLERQRKISTYTVYDGYIEEVLLRGRDNSDIDFYQGETITVYNLDFCNQITSPIQFIDEKGDIQEAYKFDAVRKLLEYQRKNKEQGTKFIMFLTINCGYQGAELHNFITHHGDRNISDYHSEVKRIPAKPDRDARFLKSYVLESLKEYFKTQGFIPGFLPVIYYRGTGDSALLHFTVFGTAMLEKTGTAPFYQDICRLLKQRFITTGKDGFELMNNEYIPEEEVFVNPVEIFSSSHTYKRYWSKT